MTLRTQADADLFRTSARINVVGSPVSEKHASVTIQSEDPEQTMALIIRILSETGLVPLRVETVEPKLEDIFLEVIR